MEANCLLLDELVEKSQSLVLSLCARNHSNHDDMLDVFQSVYCRLLEMLRTSWQPPDDVLLGDVIFRLTMRESDRVRRHCQNERRRYAPADNLLLLVDPRPNARQNAENNELTRRVRDGVASLDTKQCELLRLWLECGLSHQAIATRYGCSRSTVTRRLAAAIERLRVTVENE
jgi:RNA polymerase sigma factor (sigma-70 family)